MNSNFKEELALFVRDMREICDGRCFSCPMGDKTHGVCRVNIPSGFDTDKAIAAVEAHRRRKKPCAEVINRALDVYMIELQIERKGALQNSFPVTAHNNAIRLHIENHYKALIGGSVAARVVLAKRYVLDSYKESDEAECT